jgi:beta-glucosidase
MSEAELSRRSFIALAGAAAVAGRAEALANDLTREAVPASRQAPARFPDGFRWGTATSAYQIEGAWNQDGKGASIWDTYTHRPGKIKNGDTGDVACDHYHRYREDVQLLKRFGMNSYRFSISWPRVFPNGVGQPNLKGLDFYNRLVDELLANGIAPFPTLYHWDLPQALQDKGGWQNRDTANAFAQYAGYIAAQLSDRVRHFFTLNELQSFVDGGHRGLDANTSGGIVHLELAPGLKLTAAALNQVRHHAVLAHGLSVQAIRANGRRGTQCGPAEALRVAIPLIETREHIKAAEVATRELNAPFLTVMLEGRYIDAYLEKAGNDAPKFTLAELEIIAEPIDFVGINVYRPSMYVLTSGNAFGYREIPFSTSHPRMFSAWQALGPETLYWGPKLVQSLWAPRTIYISENGCAAADVLAPDGDVYDTDRIMFMRNALTQLRRATEDGVPVRGYFLSSALDTFEWVNGYSNRYGMVYVDFTTQKRTPKMSAHFFREICARNVVV